MRVRLLGPLEVEGAPFRGGPKQRVLLASLILARGLPVSDHRLVDALWQDSPPASASHALQVYVSELRKAGLAIERGNGGYRLEVEYVDADEFERLVEQARTLRESGREELALESLEQGLALWRGPPLPGLDAEAVAAEIGRLEELRLGVLEERAECALALGRVPDLRELEALLEENPLRERLRRLQMLALYRAGRQAEALAAYRQVREALDELGLEPGAELKALERAILLQDTALDVEPEALRLRRHLPAPATALVGRRAEVDTVTDLLRGDTRLVTLTGPGGAGKTRVALRAAYELADCFAEGVWFVGLATLVDPALVRSTIAQVLDVRDDELRDTLRDRELLLLLDNFEQLLGAAPVVGELLQGAPRLRVLTTSRTPLRVYGEHELDVPPLPAPEAEELFLTRARAAGRELSGRLAAQVCERLDGLPLAIELVAARSADLTPDELVASLDRRLELASRGARDLPERQRTLRAAIGWSHDLLGAAEQRLFARLAAFAGGFGREAALAVCEAAGEALTALHEGNLVRRSDEGRYRMLETIREYAVERLRADGEEHEVRLRHANHFLELGGELVAALGGRGRRRGIRDVRARARQLQGGDRLRRRCGSHRAAGPARGCRCSLLARAGAPLRGSRVARRDIGDEGRRRGSAGAVRTGAEKARHARVEAG